MLTLDKSVHGIGDLNEQRLSMSANMCNVGTGYLSQHSLSMSPYMFIGGIDDICQHKLCESEYEYNDSTMIGHLSHRTCSLVA